jgi:ABC-type polysaccharide/polyol phosphate transport system ATPase subunit
MSSSLSPAGSPIISLRGVTKTYTIWDDPSARLFAPLKRMLGVGGHGQQGRLFTAVQDVSLEIAAGECIGIIGRNGAGKSTLLQMIAGTVRPTSGQITVRGRVAALLELGSGFNPDFTGRENIQLNAAILGLSAGEIAAKYDSIVAYSGIEEFIDQPVRTYSSGMTLRLAFAVCAHVDAEILIIDEALAVGDARFQFKCHATLEQMLKDGCTIIFVSHDTNAIKRMCRTALLLERGQVLLQGSPNDVTNIYTKLITSPHGVEAIRDEIAALKEQGETPLLAAASPVFVHGSRQGETEAKEQGEVPLLVAVSTSSRPRASRGATSPAFVLGSGASSVAKPRQRRTENGGQGAERDESKTEDIGQKPEVSALSPSLSLSLPSSERLLVEERSHQQISDKEYAYGGEHGRITTVELTDEHGAPRLSFLSGSRIRVRFACVARAPVTDPIYALTLKDIRGQEIFGTNTYFQNQTPPAVPAAGQSEAVFDLQLNVLPGVYFISLGWVRLVNGEVQVIHRRYDVLRFDVLPCDQSFGIAWCPAKISVTTRQ